MDRDRRKGSAAASDRGSRAEESEPAATIELARGARRAAERVLAPEIRRWERQIAEQAAAEGSLTADLESVQRQLASRDREAVRLEEQIAGLVEAEKSRTAELESIERQLESRDREVVRLEALIAGLVDAEKSWAAELESIQRQLESRNREAVHLEARVAELVDAETSRTAELESIQRQLESRDREAVHLEARIAELVAAEKSLTAELESRDRGERALRDDVEALRRLVAAKEQRVRALETSYSFRFGHAIARTLMVPVRAWRRGRLLWTQGTWVLRNRWRQPRARPRPAAGETPPVSGARRPLAPPAPAERAPLRPARAPKASPAPAARLVPASDDGGPPSSWVKGNRWTDLDPPAPGEWQPTRRVSVIVPYYRAQAALEITLAALARQTYPRDLTEVVVADDGSPEPPAIPDGLDGLEVRVVRQPRRGFGLARARNTGAAAAEGEILIFVDCDMVPEPGWLEAHARWHHLVADAVTIGFRRHADFDGISAGAVADAAAAGDLEPLFAGRRQQSPEWIEVHLERWAEMTSDHDDLFRVACGGNLGVRAETFAAVGGCDESFDQWGAEDIELGYRFFTYGALMVPERGARCWHQGLNEEGAGQPDSEEQRSLEQQRAKIAHLIAQRSFRRQRPGRSFRVPYAVVRVDVDAEPREQVLESVEAILAGGFHDLAVCLDVPEHHPDAVWLRRQLDGDPRVRTGAALDDHRLFPHAAVRVHVPPFLQLSGVSLGRIVDRLWKERLGVLHVDVPGALSGISAFTTRAWRRASRLVRDPVDVERLAAELFGEGRLEMDDVRVGAVVQDRSRVVPRSTPAAGSRTVPRESSLSFPPRWNVAFLGDRGRESLGAGLEAVAVDAESEESLAEQVGPELDFLVVDAGEPAAAAGARVEEARALGARIVRVGEGPPAGWPPDAEVHFRPAAAGGGRLVTVPPVDVGRVRPTGYRRDAGARWAVVAQAGAGIDSAAAAAACGDLLGGLPVDVFELGDGAEEPASAWSGLARRLARRLRLPSHGQRSIAGVGALLDELRAYRAVVDHPGLDGDEGRRAARIAALAAAGVPVLAPRLSGALRGLLGAPLAEALAAVSPEALADPDDRERLSVRLRRTALRDHSCGARWRQIAAAAGLEPAPAPRVGILLATHRPRYLDHLLAQVERQSYEPLELVLALHGDGFPSGVEHTVAERVSCPTRVIRVDGDRTLGAVLAAAAEASSGELLTKMDSDDWYGADHVLDLVLALEYSGAHLVGKGAEWVYLRGSDATIRRYEIGAETANLTLGGGALMIRRSDLEAVGGWRDVPKEVDQRLIHDVLAAGGSVFRTHGFGYLLHRHGSGHTWDQEDAYFLQHAVVRRPGLDLASAGIDES